MCIRPSSLTDLSPCARLGHGGGQEESEAGTVGGSRAHTCSCPVRQSQEGKSLQKAGGRPEGFMKTSPMRSY